MVLVAQFGAKASLSTAAKMRKGGKMRSLFLQVLETLTWMVTTTALTIKQAVRKCKQMSLFFYLGSMYN
jgi:hypothetical protein